MYFVGVTTAQPSIHKLFPKIADLAGVPDAVLTGINIPVNGSPQLYVDTMRRIREDSECWGALVTTHKVNLCRYAGELFDAFDQDARLLGEVSCIVKREAKVTGIAVDPIASMLAYEDLGSPRGDVLIFGAGGAAAAIAVALRRRDPERRIVMTDVSEERLAHVQKLAGAEVYAASRNTEVLGRMLPGSFIVNATGMGKDVPGSPVDASAVWPAGCIAWDLNYRGDLKFLKYAKAGGALVHNGWDYFLHGWTQIMSRVYGFPMTPELLAQTRNVANQLLQTLA
jgi:shikimate dehydrogenase